MTYTNGSISKQATITVEAEAVDQTVLEVKDSTIKQGSSWQASDNLVKALDADGKDVREEVANTAQGTVDTSTPGKYVVTYTNGSISKQA
ncbi:bacterial Ig-like domain-containing protein, partial [Enterococcus sp. C76]|uniref:bacterial Ig-like domain-containing protein n=1 Tax=Enterococcus sp. C76 TaxID=3231334 RepID=UPI0034A01532